jgi:hypothetical protein
MSTDEQLQTFHRITVPSSSKPNNPHLLRLLKLEDEVTTILPQAPHKLPGDITDSFNCG